MEKNERGRTGGGGGGKEKRGRKNWMVRKGCEEGRERRKGKSEERLKEEG